MKNAIFVVTLIFILPIIATQMDQSSLGAKGVCEAKKAFSTVKFTKCVPRKVLLTVCSGKCFSIDNVKSSRSCTCCKPTQTKWSDVDVRCYGTDNVLVVVRRRVKQATSCSCSPCFDAKV